MQNSTMAGSLLKFLKGWGGKVGMQMTPDGVALMLFQVVDKFDNGPAR